MSALNCHYCDAISFSVFSYSDTQIQQKLYALSGHGHFSKH